jgi:hypothetical protein
VTYRDRQRLADIQAGSTPSAPICDEAICPMTWYSTLSASGCWKSAKP